MNQAMLSDSELLQQFVASGEQAPFEALVNRHSSMVFGICCRVLGRTHDAEDAAQAVFLTLAHKAHSLRHHTSIVAWLHRVAYNVSLRTREAAERRSHREAEVGKMNNASSDDSSETEWKELRPILDDELNQLPEKLRIPFILHYIEGRTQEEIAVLLGCTYGTVSGRLNQARTLLRERLERRRLAVTASALFLMIPKHAPIAMPVTVANSCVKAAALIAAGNAAAPGLVSTQAAALTQGALKAMYIAKLKAAAVILVAVLGVGGVCAATYQSITSAAPPGSNAIAAAQEPAKPAPMAPKEVVTEKKAEPAQPLVQPAAEPAKPQPPVAPPAGPQVEPPSKADLEAWIAGLGNADIKVRTENYLKLRNAGEAVRAGLEAASTSDKAEVSSAAKTLLAVLKVKPIIDKVTETAKDVKTVEADMKMTTEAMGAKVNGTGNMKMKCADKKMVFTMKIDMGGMQIPMLMVNDGTTWWQEITMGMGEKGMKMVLKYPAEYMDTLSKQNGGNESPLDASKYTEQFDFTEVAESTWEGKNVYILSGTPRPGWLEDIEKKAAEVGGATAGQMAKGVSENTSKTQLTIGKDDHLIYRFETLDKNGKSTQDTQLSNIKLNPVLEDAIFTYCPPPDAQVIDGVEQMKAMKAKADAAAQPAAPPPAAPNF